MILVGDAPLVDDELLSGLVQAHREGGTRATVATSCWPSPAHYGRVVRDAQRRRGRASSRRATPRPQELRIAEVNTGFYVFGRRSAARRAAPPAAGQRPGRATTSPTSCSSPSPTATAVAAYRGADAAGHGRDQLARRAGRRQRRHAPPPARAPHARRRHRRGPGHHLRGLGRPGGPRHASSSRTRTCWAAPSWARAARSARAASCATPSSATAPASSSSHLYECVISSGCNVGPFAYIRPNTVLAEGAKAGTFVEIKNSRIGEGSKVPHLSYVGDAIVGDDSNIAAGNITANYDGYDKHADPHRRRRAHRQRHRHRGAGDHRRRRLHGGRLHHHRRRAAEGALAVAREKQTNIEGYAERRAARGSASKRDPPDRITQVAHQADACASSGCA